MPTTVLDGAPCTDALTPGQVQPAIGVGVAGIRKDLPEIGPACAWSIDSTGGAVGVSSTLTVPSGTSGQEMRSL